jgi:3-methylfumaryl-CoA hydratase
MTEADAAITPEEIERWRAYVGRSETRRQVLDIESARRFAAAVGADLDVERTPPPLGHWAYFLEAVGQDGLGPDGHPRRGEGLLPPVRLPRRMFASAAMTFAEPLFLGHEAELTLTVAEVNHRSGRTGDLVFVEVDRTLTQDGRVRLTERQTIVYRGVGVPTPAVRPSGGAALPGDEVWTPGPVDLFRMSAVTFNSHRIHYDLPYATGEEGYPGLVVHGPFTAVKLCALARARAAAPLTSFSFRANAPLFVGQPVRLRAGTAPGAVEAVRCDGVVAMTAQASV